MHLSAPLAGWPLAAADSWVPEHASFFFQLPFCFIFSDFGHVSLLLFKDMGLLTGTSS